MGPTRFIKSFQKEKRRKLFANMPISCWSKSVLSMGRCLICSQFIIWVLFRQQGTVKRQSPIIIKEMRANRKCWLPGLIYNYEHLLIASSSSQYLTVCHAMRLSLVCTRLSSHWCKKKNETETYNLLILPDDRQYTRSPRNPCCCGIPALHVLHLVKCDCWSLLYWSLTRQQGGQ